MTADFRVIPDDEHGYVLVVTEMEVNGSVLRSVGVRDPDGEIVCAYTAPIVERAAA